MTANGNSNSSTNKDNVPIKLHYPSYQSAAGNPRTNLVQGKQRVRTLVRWSNTWSDCCTRSPSTACRHHNGVDQQRPSTDRSSPSSTRVLLYPLARLSRKRLPDSVDPVRRGQQQLSVQQCLCRCHTGGRRRVVLFHVSPQIGLGGVQPAPGEAATRRKPWRSLPRVCQSHFGLGRGLPADLEGAAGLHVSRRGPSDRRQTGGVLQVSQQPGHVAQSPESCQSTQTKSRACTGAFANRPTLDTRLIPPEEKVVLECARSVACIKGKLDCFMQARVCSGLK